MDHVRELYITIPIDLTVYYLIQPPNMKNKAQFIMDVLGMAQFVRVYELIPKSLSPFGKVALAFDLCKKTVENGLGFIEEGRSIDHITENRKLLENIIQKLLSYVPESSQNHLYTEWNQSRFADLDSVHYREEISKWIHTIRQHIFD